MRDFLSVELVQGGHVSAKMSLGGGTAVATVTSNVVRLNNGRWHNVMLKIKSKVTLVLYQLQSVMLWSLHRWQKFGGRGRMVIYVKTLRI